MSIRRAPRPVAAVLMALLGLFLLVEALVIVVAGDVYTSAFVEMMERTMPGVGSFQAGWTRTFERFVPITLALSIATALVHVVIGLLIPRLGWARIVGVVIAVLGALGSWDLIAVSMLLPQLAVPRPVFVWLHADVGVPVSAVAAGLLGVAYVVVIIDLARRPPLREG